MGAVLEVRRFGDKGRGVVATTRVRVGEVIEICPVVAIDESDRQHIDRTRLYDYYFYWPKAGDGLAIALGFGSLYNHSYDPNAIYTKNVESGTVTFTCIREIAANEEITVNYNGDPADQKPVWFEKKRDAKAGG